jgi:predicted dehydrogenase
MPTVSPAPAPLNGFFRNRSLVRWGIIGCGDVTEVKSGPGFRLAQGSALTAVMRRDAARAADYAKRHGVPRWYADTDALISDPTVDAVYIATPPESHLACALKVAAAGKPAYVEKPMARHSPECDAMVHAFAAARLPLFVAYYRRRLPRFLLVQELLQQAAIGRVTGIRYCQAEAFHRREGGWRIDATAAGGGHFLDVGSHTLDLMDFFFGPLRDVAGTAANLASDYAPEDSVALSFRTEGEIPGSAMWDFAAGLHRDCFCITGTDGQIEFPVFDSGPVNIETAGGTRAIACEQPPHVAQPLIQSVVDDLLGRGVCPSTGESARRTSRVMDIVLHGYYGGRDDDFWTRPQSWTGRRK